MNSPLDYRAKFADNLKRELLRIPLAPPCDQSRDRERADRPREGAGRRTRPVQGPAATDRQGSADEPSAATHRQDGGATGSDGGATGSQVGNRWHKSSGFWAFAKAGRRLAELHIGYEALEPWPLEWLETPGEPLSYVVEKMRLSKDKKSVKVNDSLTLGGIPPEVFEYRLGNRSALEWVIDQYRVKEDKRSGIRSDRNNPEDPEYIVRLVGQVVRVSVETVRIVHNLPEQYAPPGETES